MVSEQNEQEPRGPSNLPVPAFQQSRAVLSNLELLSGLDLTLLEPEKRLLPYARVGLELIEMADEGLVLAVRGRAWFGRILSAAQHTESHLQIVGAGEWKPRMRVGRCVGLPHLILFRQAVRRGSRE